MISLIAATVNRTEELGRLLASLDRQTYRDFEVIIVDQNPDDRLAPILAQHPGLTIRRFRSERGLSRARNVGLGQVKGDLVSFPDDDCWYPDELLATVVRWFEVHPGFDALFTGTRTPDNRQMAPKWAPAAGECTRSSVLKSVVAFTGFLRKRVTDAVGLFNERIGVGSSSRYQSGEDIDYYIRPLDLHFRMWYEPGLTVYHPEFQSIERLRQKTYGYALGVGYVLRVNRYSSWTLGDVLLRSLAGSAVSLCRGDLRRTHIYLLRAAGELWGYVFGPTELQRERDSNPPSASTA